jgi:hypothetical protein
MRELMLGYDLLANPEIATWADRPATARELFFVRPEILWPISVDRVTCPSIFQPEFDAGSESTLVLTRFPLHSANRPRELRAITGRKVDWNWSELNSLGFWSDFTKMRTWLRRRPTLEKVVRFGIAVRVCLDSDANSDPVWQPVFQEQRQGSLIVDDADRLGFDVATSDRSSFLSGYEHAPEEINDARMRWSVELNDWGLLKSVEGAIAFREFSNVKMPESAPFYVYEISRLTVT